MFVTPEDNAHNHAEHPQHGKETCCSTSLTHTKHFHQQTIRILMGHQRFKDAVYRRTALHIAHRDGKELQ